MRRASADTDRLDLSLQGVIGQRAMFVAALGGMAVGLAKVIKSAANAGDEMFDMSRKFGLSVETVSQMKFVAEQSGASIEDVGKAMRTLSKNAVTNSAEFRKWGVELKNSDGTMRTTEELFMAAARRIEELESNVLKTAAAQDLFGRSGTELLQVLQLGEDGIQALRDRADELGVTMSTESAVAANQFNNRLAELTSTVGRAKDEFGIELLPILDAYVRKITDVISWTKKSGEIFEYLGAAVSPLKAVWDYNVGVLGTVADKLGWTEEVTEEAANTTKKLKDQLEESGFAAARQATSITKAASAISKYSNAAKSASIIDFSGEAGEIGEQIDAALAASDRTDAFKRTWNTAIHSVAADYIASQESMAEAAIAMDEKQQEIWKQNQQAAAMAASGTIAAWGTAFESILTGSQSASEAIMQAVIRSAEVSIQAAAASGAAQAAFSQAGIPIIGPALAVAASALIFGLIRGFLGKITQAAQGGLVVGGIPGRDSVPLMTMPGERVLSVEDNQRLIRAVESGSRNVNIVFNSTMPPTTADTMRAARHLSKQLRRVRSRGH